MIGHDDFFSRLEKQLNEDKTVREEIDPLDDDRFGLPEKKENKIEDTLDSFKSLFEEKAATLKEKAASLNLKEKTEEFKAKASEFKKEADEKSEEILEKADDLADDIINKAFGFFSTAKEKAKETLEKTKDYTYDLEEKMRKKEEDWEKEREEKRVDPNESLLKKYDSFFDKAKNFTREKLEDTGIIKDTGTVKITKSELKETKKSDSLTGFNDADGDGDPIVDDAIIEK